jgi:DNA invertase Pin-like site-specific DNA recombinase
VGSVAEYVVRGFSGAKDSRPALDELLAHAKARRVFTERQTRRITSAGEESAAYCFRQKDAM